MANLTNDFKMAIEDGGLWSALHWLNGRVPYRYSAIFAFEGDTLRNVCLVDKENSSVTQCESQPVGESYCVYIQQSGERFSVEDASFDPRVQGHPKQRSFLCYYGIPLLGPNGQLLGTVCHFNFAPVRVTEDIVTALDDLAPLITEAAFRTP